MEFFCRLRVSRGGRVYWGFMSVVDFGLFGYENVVRFVKFLRMNNFVEG